MKKQPGKDAMHRGSNITKGHMADLSFGGSNSIDVMVWDICEDGEHAIVGNSYHPKESFPVEITRLTPLDRKDTTYGVPTESITILQKMINELEKSTGVIINSAHATFARNGNELDKISLAIRCPRPITDVGAEHFQPIPQ